jgi:hypothetical protein
VAQQAPADTQPAPATTQAAPAITQPAPTIPAPAGAPLTAGEKTELRKQLGKLEDALESLDDKLLAREIRKACRLIEGVLQATTVSSARLTEVNDSIAEVSTTIAKVSKAAQRSTRNTSSSSQAAADEPDVLPVDILVGGAMANRDKWPYREIVEREMTTMVNGGVWLGSDGTPSLSLGVRGHWQPGDKPPHFIKIYIDEAEMGKRTKMRAYFRYRVVNGHLVIKLVAICEEHRSVEKTLVGDKDDVIGDDGT